MPYVYGNPRSDGEDSGGSKTLNYLNLAVGGASAGYTPDQINSFVEMIATATNKNATGLKMTAERPIEESE